MRALSTLLPSLALPVVVSGFQALSIMPPSVSARSISPVTMNASPRKRANASSAAPLRYTDDPNAIDANAAQTIALSIPKSGATASAALRLATKVPVAAAVTAFFVFLTNWLSGYSTPAAQGVKLVYAGAIAGIISRTFCAPIEMVSTVMMCRGDECTSMSYELSETWKKEGLRGMFKGNGANCLKVAPSRGTQVSFARHMHLDAFFLHLCAHLTSSCSLSLGSSLCTSS